MIDTLDSRTITFPFVVASLGYPCWELRLIRCGFSFVITFYWHWLRLCHMLHVAADCQLPMADGCLFITRLLLFIWSFLQSLHSAGPKVLPSYGRTEKKEASFHFIWGNSSLTAACFHPRSFLHGSASIYTCISTPNTLKHTFTRTQLSGKQLFFFSYFFLVLWYTKKKRREFVAGSCLAYLSCARVGATRSTESARRCHRRHRRRRHWRWSFN